MRYIISAVVIGLLLGMATGTIWLNQEPSYSLSQVQPVSAVIKPANMTPMEIIRAPFFPLAAGSNLSLGSRTELKPYVISSSKNLFDTPAALSFSQGFENNMAYASKRSSLKIGQGEKWTDLSLPWILK